MANLKEIAAKTGLSINTVSRGLRQSGYVSETARGKILNAAAELGYSPNRAARSLRFSRNFEIVAVNFLHGHELYCDALNLGKIMGMKNRLAGSGYELNLNFAFAQSAFHKKTASFMADVLKHNPAGLIIMGESRQCVAMAETCREKDIPAVLISSAVIPDLDCVYIDRAQGVRDAVSYLAAQGRQHIAFVGPLSCANRMRGYREGIQNSHLQELIIEWSYPDSIGGIFEAGVKAAQAILRRREKIDAIQAYSDYLAAGLVAGFAEAGKNVPRDIAVIGFDNRELAGFTSPPLTTIAQPNAKVGELCVDLVLRKIEKKDAEAPLAVKVPMSLERRTSS